jgi:hypothetical protein
MIFGGIDLDKDVFAVWNSQGDLAVPYLMIPVVFVLIYALAGSRPLSGGRTFHLIGASLISIFVPQAVVLYLLTMLLVNIGMTTLLTWRPSSALERRRTFRGFPLPADRLRDGTLLMRGGWSMCIAGTALVAVWFYLMLSALPADLSTLILGQALSDELRATPYGLLGMYMFAKGVEHRWMGQLFLSYINAYRNEHGFPQPTESLAALNHALPRQSRRTGISLMAMGGLGVCGFACFEIVIGLRYLWDVAGGGASSPWAAVLHLGLGTMEMAAGNVILRAGNRHLQKVLSSAKDLVAGSYVLYLRSFEEDPKLARLSRVLNPTALVRGFFTAGNTEEERLTDALVWAGLPVGVGRPGDRLPHTGIPRVYLPLQGWQEPVLEMMRGASLVVIVLGRGLGTLWELGEAMRLLPPERLLLLVTMPRPEYDRCRELVDAELRAQAGRVRRDTGVIWEPPTLPDHAGRRMVTSRIRGLIYFTPRWTAVFAPLERPPILENQLMGALDRSMWPAAVQLTDYELQTGKRHG